MGISAADSLHVWNITLESGETRTALGSSAQAVIGNAPNVVSVTRGAVFTPGPAPVVSSLVPATAKLGDPNFTLHVHGTDFREGAKILWNGSPEPTTFVSATELTTLVNMATAQVAVDIPVAVRSLAGQDSNIVTFALTAA